MNRSENRFRGRSVRSSSPPRSRTMGCAPYFELCDGWQRHRLHCTWNSEGGPLKKNPPKLWFLFWRSRLIHEKKEACERAKGVEKSCEERLIPFVVSVISLSLATLGSLSKGLQERHSSRSIAMGSSWRAASGMPQRVSTRMKLEGLSSSLSRNSEVVATLARCACATCHAVLSIGQLGKDALRWQLAESDLKVLYASWPDDSLATMPAQLLIGRLRSLKQRIRMSTSS